MLNNVKDFGACGDGIEDDRAAIQAAIDNAVKFTPQGGIFFPAGTYRVSRIHVPGSGGCSLDLNGVQDFMVMREGPKSVVKLVDTTQRTGDWFVFLLRNNCGRVVFKDLVIDGNRAGLTKPDQQSHAIEVESGTEDLVVDRCILRECFGDGMRLLGKGQGGRVLSGCALRTVCFRRTNDLESLSSVQPKKSSLRIACSMQPCLTIPLISSQAAQENRVTS
jgi:hypothetical protein